MHITTVNFSTKDSLLLITTISELEMHAKTYIENCKEFMLYAPVISSGSRHNQQAQQHYSLKAAQSASRFSMRSLHH